jgi:hypothetical protein
MHRDRDGVTLLFMAMTPAERKRAQRTRERAGLEEGEYVLRSVDDMLGPAIAETLAALDLGPEHAAAAMLAVRYAKCIDRAENVGYAVRWLGPLLADVLAELGATPLARARMTKGAKVPARTTGMLQQLREARVTSGPGH